MPSDRPSRIRFGVFEADLQARLLWRDGRRVKIQAQPFAVLVALLEKPGGFVSREELRRALWDEGTFADFEPAINTAVRKLRDALGDDAHSPRFVETVPGGYRFIAPLAALPQRQSPLSEADRPRVVFPDGVVARRPRASRRVTLALALAGLAAAVLLLPRLWTPSLPGAWAFDSLAVLPFADLSAPPVEEYFADGLTESLISELAKLPGLDVISRTSIMTYKNRPKKATSIARELGVEAILEGTVVRAGNRVRITAQLVDAHADRHLWSETYEHELDDILTLQADVARAVAGQVEARLGALGAARQAQSRRRVDPRALEAYWRGRYFWNRRTSDGFAKAVEQFSAALDIDPEYAPAHAGLADTYGLMGISGYELMPLREAMPRAREAARRALQLDESLAEAHTSMAWVHFTYDWNFAAAEREFRRAIELNPSYATAHQWYSNMLCALGRLDEAADRIGRARALDPLSLVVHNESAWPDLYARRYDAAIARYGRTLELNPDYPTAHLELGMAYTAIGRYSEALREYETFSRLTGRSELIQPYLAQVHALRGERRQADEILAGMESTARTKYVAPYHFALVHAALGRPERALDWLELALAERADILLYIGVDPAWDGLRNNPRFVRLLERIGLRQATRPTPPETPRAAAR